MHHFVCYLEVAIENICLKKCLNKMNMGLILQEINL